MGCCMRASSVRPRSGRGCNDSMSVDRARSRKRAFVRIRDFLAVVAPREWDAVRALRALKASWSEAATLPSFDTLFDTVRATPVARTETLRSIGDATAALATARASSRRLTHGRSSRMPRWDRLRGR